MRRSHLLLSTALRAAALTLAPVAVLADGPPAPTALPTGMRLVAGSANAVTQGATLIVNQHSGRAAIDWKTFDIGASASVRFHDPSSQSVTLNRVIGANASQIAGRLSSNGQIIVINQSGVVFLPGSVVDAQSIVAAAAGITEANMRAGVASGQFVLDQPARQGARVENQGTITVRQAGLAALVGPQVANSGVIHAPMGHVVLAGVASNVVDLYGDGLLSIDVTKQSVELAGPGGETRTALVTNTGVILAEGGSVTLTTAAVEGVIYNLVTAGGSISTDSATAAGGRVVVDARGGSAIVTGALSARGGTTGGQIVATASQRVSIAAGANLNASGATGGGTIAIGTTLARAIGGATVKARTARFVTVAAGALIAADAATFGSGGIITVLSSESSLIDGSFNARGGTLAGNGGAIELSGEKGFRWGGAVDARAPHGTVGGITFDPGNIDITNNAADHGGSFTNTSSTTNARVYEADITTAGLTASVTVKATGTISVDSGVALVSKNGLVLNAGTDIDVLGASGTLTAASIASSGAITFIAGANITIGGSVTAYGTGAAGVITLTAGTTSTTGSIIVGNTLLADRVILAAAGAIAINADINAAGVLNVSAGSGVTQGSVSTITTSSLTSGGITGSVALTGTNSIAALGPITVTAGNLAVATIGTLTIAGAVSVGNGHTIALNTPALLFAAAGTFNPAGSLAAPGGVVELAPQAAGPVTLGSGDANPLIHSADLVNITTGLLRIGATRGVTTASGISVNGIFDAGVKSLELDAATLGIGFGGVTAASVAAASLQLTTTGTIGESTASTLTATDIGASAGGAVNLFGAGNLFLTLDAVTAGGAVSIFDKSGLMVGGALDAAGQSVSLNAQGTLAVSAPITAASLDVTTTGTLSQSATGTLSLASLSGGVGGPIILANATNAIQALGDLSSLQGARNITVATSGGLTISGLVSGSTVDLSTGGTLSEGTGSIQAIELLSTGGLGGAVHLDRGRDSIQALGRIAVTGPVFAIADTRGIIVDGAVSVASGGVISVVAPSLRFGGGSLAASGGTVEVAPQGAVSAATIGAGTGALMLGSDLPNITATTLRIGRAEGVTSASGLTVTGPFDAMAFATLDLESLGGGIGVVAVLSGKVVSLDSTGALSMGTGSSIVTTGSLELAVVGATQAAGAVIGTPILTTDGAIDGAIVLDSGVNRIVTLDAISGVLPSSISNLMVRTATSLDVTGAIAASGVTLNSAGTIGIAADIAAVTNLDLTAYGAVTQAGAGSISTALLTSAGGIVGALTLGSANNRVAAVGPVTVSAVANGSAENLSLTTAGSLNVTGALSADTIVLSAGGTIGLGASVQARTSLDLAAATGITQTAGGITTATLLSSAGISGDVSLTTANAITSIGRFAATGRATLVDATLSVAGAVSVGDGHILSIASNDFSMAAGGSLSAGNTGLIEIGPDASATTIVNLGGGTSGIRPGDLSAITAGTLRLGHSTADGGTWLAASITIGGAANAAHIGTLDLQSSGTVTQTAGAVSLATLTGHAGGGLSIALVGNTIATLGSLSAGGPIDIASSDTAQALQVAGPVSTSAAGDVTLSSPTLAISGTITPRAGNVMLAANSFSLTGAINDLGNTVGLTPFTTGGTLTLGAVGGIMFTTAADFGSGTTLELDSAGIVTQAANASVSADFLTGTGGGATLDQGNHIGVLDSFTSAGAFTLVNAAATPLTVDGPMSVAGPALLRLGAATMTINPGTLYSQSAVASGGGVLLQTNALGFGPGSGIAVEATSGVAISTFNNVATAQTLTGPGRALIVAPSLVIGGDGSVTHASALSLGHVAFVGTSLDLVSIGGIVQTDTLEMSGGATLNASAGTGMALDTKTNVIATLGNISTQAGNIAIWDDTPVTLGGSISAPGTIALSTTGLLTLGGAVSAGALVSVLANGMTEAGGSLTAINAGGAVEIAPETVGVMIISGSQRGPDFDLAALAQVRATTLRLGQVGGEATPRATAIHFAADTVVSTPTLDLRASGAVIQPATVALTLAAQDATLTGTTGGVQLLGALNAIPRLGPYTASGGDFRLVDNRGLSVVGDISAANATLAVAGGLTIDTGSLLAGKGIVDLTAVSGTEDAAGIIAAATLTSSGTPSGIFDFRAANQIAALGAWGGPAGTLALNDAAPGGLAITGTVGVATLDLSSAGIIGESGAGSVTATLLRSRLGATGTSLGAVNTIGTLGAFSVGVGAFALNNGVSTLGVAGVVSGGGIALTSSALLTIGNGGVLQAAGGTVNLMTGGATETGGGVINAGTLTGTQALAGDFILTGGNTIGTLGHWTTTGALVLTDTGATLLVSGLVAVPTLTLSAQALQLAGNITTGTASFSGATDQIDTGILNAGTVNASGASLDLHHTSNLVGTLGSVDVAGVVRVADNETLTTSSVSGGSVSLTTTGDLRVVGSTTGTTAIVVEAAGALALLDSGSLNTPAGTLDLTSAGATETGNGRIRAGTLLSTGTPGGTIDLTGTGNVVANLGRFAMGGGALKLADSVTLNVGDTGHVAHLVLSAPGIAIAGTLDGGIVDLSASVAGVTEGAGGTMLAGLLTSSGYVIGGVTLTNADNVVATLGAFATRSGDFSLTSHPGLSVAGIVSAPDMTLATPGTLSITDGGALAAPAGFVDLTANGASESGTGHIQAATLQSISGQAAGLLALTGANAIGTLGRFTMPAGTLSLTDSGTLTLGGPFSGPNLTLSAPGLIFAGNVLPATQVLDLTIGAGGVSQSGGTIATALLTGSVGGTTTLGSGNAIASLGALSGTGAVAITNARDLTITGAARAPSGIALHVTGTLSEAAGGSVTTSALRGASTGAVVLGQAANAIDALAFNAGGAAFHLADARPLAIDGPLVAGSVTLNVAGDVTERGGGVIETGLFTGSARNFLLTAANGIATLGSVGVTGTVRLTDAGQLTLTDTSLIPSLTLNASGITLAGLAQGGTVDLTATSGGVNETAGGSLHAGLLTSAGNVVGGVTLTNAANVVGLLGAFATSGGDFALTSQPGLTVTGIVSAPDITLATPGALSIVDGSALVSLNGFVDLTANGASESGTGHIQAATLQSVGGQAAGLLALNGANSIGTLGRFTMASGALALTDTGTLTVGGPVTVPNLVLTAPGVVFAGDAHLGTLNLAVGNGGVAQASGTIDAGLVTGTVAGAAALGDANAIVDLGNFTSLGAVLIANGRDLTITGVVSAPSGIALLIIGTLSEAGGGTLLTSKLSGLAIGDTTLTQAANAIAAIRFASNGNIRVTDSRALDIDGALAGTTITLNVNGDITESGGPITTGLFAGTAANITLMANNQTPSNKIANLGDITVPGAFTLLDGRDLAIASTLTAGTVDLSTNAGNLSGAGVILAGRLQSSGGIQGSVDLVNPGNSLGTIGNLAATGSIDYASDLDPVIDGALVAPGGLTLNVAGALTEAGAGSINTSALRGTALGGATLGAANNAIDTIAFGTGSADLSLTDGVALAITGTLAGRRIAITDAAGVTETGGIDAASLSGSATSFTLGGANQIAVLGDITTPTAILLVDAGPLAITGTVRTAAFDLSMLSGDVTESGTILTGTLSSGRGMAGRAVLASASNQIGMLGNIQAGGNLVVADSAALTIAGSLTARVVDLSTSAGGIDQVGGGIVTAMLSSSGGIVGDASFTQAANQIATLGAMPVSGTLGLTDATSLVVAGPVSAVRASLTTRGGIDFTGDLAVPGVLTLNTGNSVRRSAGQFAVGTLTGNVVSAADFGTGALVTTLGDFTVTDAAPGAAAVSSFALTNAQPLTLAGTLNADFIQLTATGLLTWTGDIVTEGLSRLQQTAKQPTPPGSTLSVVADGHGRAIINQTGVTHIVAQDGGIATVRLQLPAGGGQIVLGDLDGPTTDLLLFTDAGTATGRVNLAGLFVSGLNGGTSLIGTVSGQLGSAAARASWINPKPDTNYRINACPIRSVNCILLPLATVAPTNPLQDFSIGQARDDADDSDVLLPNVSDKDY